jgi:GGDEF domain-containing protein
MGMDAMKITIRIRERITKRVFDREDWSGNELSLSLGIAEYPVHARNVDELLERADWALREARDLGVNEVAVARAAD